MKLTRLNQQITAAQPERTVYWTIDSTLREPVIHNPCIYVRIQMDCTSCKVDGWQWQFRCSEYMIDRQSLLNYLIIAAGTRTHLAFITGS